MSLFKLSFAQLFGITHASVVLPSLARILQSPRGNFAGFVIPYLSRIARVDETAGRINLHKPMCFATYVIAAEFEYVVWDLILLKFGYTDFIQSWLHSAMNK